MILIKVIIISMSCHGIKFSLSLIIIIAMPEDTLYYLWSLSLPFLLIIFTISDHYHCHVWWYFLLSLIIIVMFDDNFQYFWSLSLSCLMITCILSDHTYHLIKISYCFDPDELFNWKKRKQRVLFWFHPTFLWQPLLIGDESNFVLAFLVVVTSA